MATGQAGVAGARSRAFTALVDADLVRAYRLAAVILGNQIEAEDAVGDAIVRAWERFDGLRDPAAFGPWFQRILVNGCRDRLRARRRVSLVGIESVAEPETGDGFPGIAERDALRHALGTLSADQRLVVALRFYADLSLEEIADRTGERLGTVKSRLHYGVQALRSAYDAAARDPREGSR